MTKAIKTVSIQRLSKDESGAKNQPMVHTACVRLVNKTNNMKWDNGSYPDHSAPCMLIDLAISKRISFDCMHPIFILVIVGIVGRKDSDYYR